MPSSNRFIFKITHYDKSHFVIAENLKQAITIYENFQTAKNNKLLIDKIENVGYCYGSDVFVLLEGV